MTQEIPTPQREIRTITRPKVAGWYVLLECGHGIQTFNPASLAAMAASWSAPCRFCRKEAMDALAKTPAQDASGT